VARHWDAWICTLQMLSAYKDLAISGMSLHQLLFSFSVVLVPSRNLHLQHHPMSHTPSFRNMSNFPPSNDPQAQSQVASALDGGWTWVLNTHLIVKGAAPQEMSASKSRMTHQPSSAQSTVSSLNHQRDSWKATKSKMISACLVEMSVKNIYLQPSD
jgi:hypothetical protein